MRPTIVRFKKITVISLISVAVFVSGCCTQPRTVPDKNTSSGNFRPSEKDWSIATPTATLNEVECICNGKHTGTHCSQWALCCCPGGGDIATCASAGMCF